ncbi:MAG: hypothetical protein QM759_18220 [Terricaulis sp.]
MSNVSKSAPRFKASASLFRLTIGMIVGGVAVWLYMTNVEVVRWADAMAIAVALVCFIAALRLFVESFDANTLGRRLQVEGASTAKEINQVRIQCLLWVVLGIALLWPVVATVNHWPAPAWAYAVTVVFLAIRIGYTMYAARHSDEFTRAYARNTIWWTYFVSQTGLIAYACAERMELVPPATAWDIMVLITMTSVVMPAFVRRSQN